MTEFVIPNNVNTTLAAAISSSAKSLTLASASNLPTLGTGQVMPLTLNDAATGQVFEVVYVTAISGSTLTIEREKEGTTAQSWSVGDYAYSCLTSGTAAVSTGNKSGTFYVAPATDPEHATQRQQVVLSGQDGSGGNQISASNNTTLTAADSGKRILTSGSTAFTVTLPSSPKAGYNYIVQGNTSVAVTLASSVTTGSPYIVMPDGSHVYSYQIPAGAGNGACVFFDGNNWRTQTFGRTVVAAAQNNDEAVNLSQSFAGAAVANVAASRSVGTTYTNSKSRPTYVSVVMTSGSAFTAHLYVDGIDLAGSSEYATGQPDYAFACALVPPGSTYKAAGGSLNSWVEIS